MGLDITAYRQIRKAEAPKLDADGYPEEWDTNWLCDHAGVDFTERHWPGRSEGVEAGTVYEFAEKLGFRAGSYGGYNEWRRDLAAMIGEPDIEAYWERDTPGPFYELIHFADNGGVIGPKVAAKLAADFAEWQTRADAHPGSWFRELYAKWRRAFELAADGGAVDFH